MLPQSFFSSCQSIIKLHLFQSLDAHHRVTGISFGSAHIEPSTAESYWAATGHWFCSDRQRRCLSEQAASIAEYSLHNTESSRCIRRAAAHGSTELSRDEQFGEDIERVIHTPRMRTMPSISPGDLENSKKSSIVRMKNPTSMKAHAWRPWLRRNSWTINCNHSIFRQNHPSPTQKWNNYEKSVNETIATHPELM